MKAPIYLDNHATTPMDPRVLEAMLPFFTEHFGNAASRTHPYGWRADEAVETARKQVAGLIGAKAKEIVFTSGATESDNLALKGVARARRDRGRHIVTSALEHKAVLDSCRALEKEGFEVTVVAPDQGGVVAAEQIEAALRDDTILVSLMWVNNEIGTVQPVREVGALCRARGVPFHVDAVQGLSVLPFDVEAMNVDLASLSAHKMYGPKGVGALYVRRRPKIDVVPLIDGGGHERGLRSGTLNVPGIVGFGQACELAKAERDLERERVGALRDRLWTLLEAGVTGIVRHGRAPQHPGNLSVGLPHVDAESLLLATNREVALSSGSACTSATLEPSHVLRAISVPHDLARSSVRFGVGRMNTEADIERAAQVIIAEAERLREKSPTWRAAQQRSEARAR